MLKTPSLWPAKALDLPPGAEALLANTRHLALLLMDRHARGRASAAAGFAADLLDATLRARITETAACAKGCSHCCTTFVSATIPEILRLADAVRTQDAATAKIADAASRAKPLSQADRSFARINCPILEAQMCSAYAVRPLVCRSLLSRSAETCLRIFRHASSEALPYLGNSVEARASVVLMLQAALTLAGLDHRHFELTQGLAAALAAPDAEQRWLRGEPVFGAVAVDEADLQPSALSHAVARLADAVRPML